MQVVGWLMENWKELLFAVQALMASYVGFMLIIPGNQLEGQVARALELLRKLGINR